MNSPSRPDPHTGLPVGPAVDGTEPAGRPAAELLTGRWARLEPLDAEAHGGDLFRASTPPDAAQRYTYLSNEPPTSPEDMTRWIHQVSADPERVYHAVVDQSTGRAEGRQAFLRIDPANRSIEIGDIYWGPAMARSRVATEAFFLAARHVFDEDWPDLEAAYEAWLDPSNFDELGRQRRRLTTARTPDSVPGRT